MMGSCGNIYAVWWNIKVNLQKQSCHLVCEYELPTNLQNFTQKDLTEVKIFQKVLGGGYFFETPGSRETCKALRHGSHSFTCKQHHTS